MSLSPINAVGPAQGLTSIQPAARPEKSVNGFLKTIASVAREANRAQVQADERVAQLAAGKTDNVHQVMLALGKAEISFNYMLEVRNKVLEAYNELKNMPL